MGAKNETWPILQDFGIHRIISVVPLQVVLRFWGANVFFMEMLWDVHFTMVIALLIGTETLFIGKDDPEELGWNRAEEIWEEPVIKKILILKVWGRNGRC